MRLASAPDTVPGHPASRLWSLPGPLQQVRHREEKAEIAMIPKNTVKVEGKDADSVLKLIEALEDLDDVQKVEGNFDIDEAALAGA